MQTTVSYHPDEELIYLFGRTDPPDCADIKGAMRPGQTAFGMTFEQLKTVSLVETDPQTGVVVKISYQEPPNPEPPNPDAPEIPAHFLKKRMP